MHLSDGILGRTGQSLGQAHWGNVESLCEAVRRLKKCFGGQENQILASGFLRLSFNFFPTLRRSGFGALAVGFHAGSRVQGVRIEVLCLFLENRGWEDLSLVPAEGSHGLERGAAGLVISVFKECFL